MIENTEFKEWREFHIGDVISITHPMLVSPRKMEDIYDILNWMTGENLFTHQLVRASKECRPILQRLYPELIDIELPILEGMEQETINKVVVDWVDSIVEKYGETRNVPRLINHTPMDPFIELFQMTDKPVVVVSISDTTTEGAIDGNQPV